MAARRENFVQGEASESDEEYEIDQSYFMKNTMVAKPDSPASRQGIVVQGEASESDESETENTANVPDPNDRSAIDSQNILTSQESGTASIPDDHTKRKVKFHYDSSFHRRLRVSNLELRSDAIENRMKIYNDANRKLQSAVFYLNRSQASAQDIFSNVGLISGDLQSITESLDQITSLNFLPTLKMPNTHEPTIPPQEPLVTS